ncbi:MAG: adenosylcobinamide-GDP ribazoletransferase [Rhodobacteraceae bacterium]|nr:adenosylcobinamide-GDP ribazoletransferase [Paracoccaceae bacterium]
MTALGFWGIGVLRQEWQLFLLAVQFLTRLPVPQELPYSDDLAIRSARYYPLVGLGVGGVGAGVLLTAGLVLSWPVAVLLSMGATLLLTGAFHEDGLADAADGLWGGATPERALEIMRDSRLGTYGAVALAMMLSLKAAILMALSPTDATVLLIAGHTLGRMACVHVIATTQYARDVGTKFVAPRVTADGYRVAFATSLAVVVMVTLWIGGVAAGSAVVVCVALAQLFRLIFVRKLGGYTGDCLGGVQQLAEVGLYLGAAAWL